MVPGLDQATADATAQALALAMEPETAQAKAQAMAQASALPKAPEMVQATAEVSGQAWVPSMDLPKAVDAGLTDF